MEKRIAHHLENADQDAWSAWVSMTDGRRELEDIGRWRKQRRYKAVINAYIDLFFQHAERNLERIETLPSTKQLLNAMVGIFEKEWFDNDFAYFLDRARKGEIVWRPDARVFERTARAEEIAITLIESERADASEFFLDASVKATRVESAPDHIADFIFARRVAEDDWSSGEGDWEAIEDYGQRLEEMEEVEGESKCEGYRCRINGIELVIVLYDSKEWVVYRYENRDVPGVPYHCKRISGKLRSMREAIKTIERWRRTEQGEFDLLRATAWNRRGKRRGRAQRSEGIELN